MSERIDIRKSMNEKEAREILEKTVFLTIESSFAEEYREEKDQRIAAFNFLAGLEAERERVNPLVKAAKRVHERYDHDGSGDKCAPCDLAIALAAYESDAERRV